MHNKIRFAAAGGYARGSLHISEAEAKKLLILGPKARDHLYWCSASKGVDTAFFGQEEVMLKFDKKQNFDETLYQNQLYYLSIQKCA